MEPLSNILTRTAAKDQRTRKVRREPTGRVGVGGPGRGNTDRDQNRKSERTRKKRKQRERKVKKIAGQNVCHLEEGGQGTQAKGEQRTGRPRKNDKN